MLNVSEIVRKIALPMLLSVGVRLRCSTPVRTLSGQKLHAILGLLFQQLDAQYSEYAEPPNIALSQSLS
jgi:hypothetical protein